MNSKSKFPVLSVDSKGCLSLSSVLASFTAAINEEQAWALVFQSLQCARRVLKSPEMKELACVASSPSHIKIHKDGSVHEDSYLLRSGFTGYNSPTSGNKCPSEFKIISQLGQVIFESLDYGIPEDDERLLSPELNALLDAMTSVDETGERPETDDEGIERDSGDSDDERMESTLSFKLDKFLQMCHERLGNGSAESEAHYKAVCRALVSEALELSFFLEKVSQGTDQLVKLQLYDGDHPGKHSLSADSYDKETNSGLAHLHFTFWAKLWVQVIQELRSGFKLKKVQCREAGLCSPIEYALTPYEILMDDIRSRRFKLKRVTIGGELPRTIQKDAHDIILDFIRSRPPLKKMSERKLRPPPDKKYDPIETLMLSIRQQHKLRPTVTSVKSPFQRETEKIRNLRRQSSLSDMSRTLEDERGNSRGVSGMENGGKSSADVPQRRLIKPDIDLLYALDKDDESDDEVQGGGVPKDNSFSNAAGSLYFGQLCPDKCQSEPVTPSGTKPLISECKRYEEVDEAFKPSRVDLRRRHSISDPSHTKDHGSTMITFPFEYTNNTLNVKSIFSLSGPSVSPILHRRKTQLPRSVSKSILQEEFFQSNHWQTAMQCLSLNLEEVVHIRNVLTKAELEGLPVDCSTKEDVEKGKICFLCLKARFSLFGPWGNQCKLCKRMVCTKCCSKMRIPMDHFAKIPVSTLSPMLSPRDEDYSLTPSKSTPTPQKSPCSGSIRRKSSLGSAPTSPTPSRKSTGTDSDSGQRSISPGLNDFSEERDRFSPDSQSGPYSLPTVSAISSGIMAFKRRGFGVKKDTEKTERLRGALMVVCHDCKAMVLQIIRSSRVNKANTLRTNLTLNLPVTTLPQIVA